MKTTSGFTLMELMIVVAIIAILSSIAVPNMLAARQAANESAAISTLRQLSSAEAQVQATAAIDGDGDGLGEYAFFGELSGAKTVRAFIAGVQTISPTSKLKPPVASSSFGNVSNSLVSRSGYQFQIWLPGPGGVAVPEAGIGGADPALLPDPDLCETTWCAYAWPIKRQNTSIRAFFVNQQGEVLQCANTVASYTGLSSMPAPSAAFAAGGTPNVITQPTATLSPTKLGMDGEVWKSVN